MHTGGLNGLKDRVERSPSVSPTAAHSVPWTGQAINKGHWLIFEERPGALASVNLRGSACVCFPCVHINLEEQHLAKSGKYSADP